MDFRILGRLEVLDEGCDITPRRPKQQALLALLLLHANESLTTERLIDGLWGVNPPDTAAKALQGHVSALRKVLGQSRIHTELGGYRLEVHLGELDLARFQAELATARGVTDLGDRAAGLAKALGMWRGEPLPNLRYETFAEAEIERLVDLRLDAVEERIEADLATGRHADVLPELEALVAAHPMRERLREQHMLALYRCGRQADALHAFQGARRLLSMELGIEPGPALRLLERRILEQDPGLDAPVTPPLPIRQERKSVTVVVIEFAADGGVDPEDLSVVFDPARHLVEDAIRRFGGTAQPLFANAMIGTFGADRAHEDDPERAVRAALRACEMVAAIGLRAHAAVETGSALVTFQGDRFEVSGEVLAAANRLHATAPFEAVFVSGGVRRATEEVIEYAEAGSGAGRALGLRRDDADVRTGVGQPSFVGRVDELALLERAFARAVREGRPQLATIVGEPGVGKSRLVQELQARLSAGREPPAWREGRCLPYGDGVTFWALGQIVKAEAGILETTDADGARGLLTSAVERLVDDLDTRSWLVVSLAPLVGVAGRAGEVDGQPGPAARELLHRISMHRPLVVVFEDLQWADSALLDFVADVVALARGPILIIGTARHEFIDTNPGWTAGARDALSIALRPLPDADGSRLLAELLGTPPPTEMVRRAGGNPLFAHELARRWSSAGAASSDVPEAIEAVIAARLDSMPLELRELASCAAVVGEVFWGDAVAAVDGVDVLRADRGLRRLVVHEVIRPARRSSVRGMVEYEFIHALVRDAAYARIPRAERGRRHLAAADWIESLPGDRTVDHAAFLAHHCSAALELVGGSWSNAAVATLTARTAKYLVLAGDRAMRLDVAAATPLYERALELLDIDHAERASVVVRLADAAQEGNRLREAVAGYEQALAALEPSGDPRDVARAMNGLARTYWRLGDTERCEEVVDEAIARLAGLPIGPELARLWGLKARRLVLAGRPAEALPWIEQAAAAAEPGGAPEVRVRMLSYLDIARIELGQRVSLADSRQAIRIGLELGVALETAVAYANLADMVAREDGPLAGLAVMGEAIQFAEQRGLTHMAARARWGVGLQLRCEAGDWDAALAEADALLESERGEGATQLVAIGLTQKALVLVSRGLVDAAEPLVAELLPIARRIADLQTLAPALAIAASLEQLRHEPGSALDLVRELEAATRSNGSWRSYVVADAVRVCVAAADLSLAETMVAPLTPVQRRDVGTVLAARAALAEAREAFADASRLHAEAAGLWGSFGHVVELGQALLGEGRCLIALHRSAEAVDRLGLARAIFARLGARPLLDETDSLYRRADVG